MHMRQAQRVVRAGAKSQVYVVGADDISPDASGELADEGNYGQDARSRCVISLKVAVGFPFYST